MSILTNEQISLGVNSLNDGKLQSSQVDDLVSFFREYLGELEGSYSLSSTLSAIDDTGNQRQLAAKLAACLLIVQDSQFGVGGFQPVSGSKSTLTYQESEYLFKIFKYAFGLLYPLPLGLVNPYVRQSSSRVSRQGFWIRRSA